MIREKDDRRDSIIIENSIQFLIFYIRFFDIICIIISYTHYLIGNLIAYNMQQEKNTKKNFYEKFILIEN